MTSALMAIGLLSACNQHTHDWGEVTYTWSQDNKTCVAERVCKGDESHKEIETANSTYAVVTEAKCETDGKGRYSVTFENEVFEAQTKEVKIDALEHDYKFDSFVWGDDYSAQAKYICSHDASHIKNETATVTSEVTTKPGCETEGVRTYTATYDGHTDTKTQAIPATDHSWGNPTYVWADDNLSCTATRVCTHDASHKETETANSTYTVVTEAKCETDGKGKYSVSFKNEAFAAQSKEVVIDALEHDYKFDSFVWADDYSAQAKYVCSHDATHIKNETATVTSEITTPAGCETEGIRTYTASFDGHTDTKTEAIPAEGHHLTAHEGHAETCTEAGNTAYWSCDVCGKFYSDENGEHQVAENSWVVAALGHNLTHHAAVKETCTEAGNIEYWTCDRCGKYFLDEQGTQSTSAEAVVVAAHHTLTHHEAKAATRLENGNIEYWSCDVCGKYFSDEEGKNEISAESVIIPALGTDKSYFNGTYWRDSSFFYVLHFDYNNFSNYDIYCEYYFSDFDYDDETKKLSFIVTRLESFGDTPSPYGVGDTISFTYDAENDVLMFGTNKLNKE